MYIDMRKTHESNVADEGAACEVVRIEGREAARRVKDCHLVICTTQVHHYTTTPLLHYTTTLIHHYTITLIHHYSTTLLHHYST